MREPCRSQGSASTWALGPGEIVLTQQAKAKANPFWPSVTTIEGARQAAHGGATVCFIVAGVTGALALASIYIGRPIVVSTPWSLLDAVAFLFAGLFTWRMSRTAASAGLLLFVGSRVYGWLAHGPASVTNPFLVVFFALFLLHGVRGTFAYARLMQGSAAGA